VEKKRSAFDWQLTFLTGSNITDFPTFGRKELDFGINNCGISSLLFVTFICHEWASHSDIVIIRRVCIDAKSAYLFRRVRPSVCLAVCPEASAWLPMREFAVNLILTNFMRNLVTVGQYVGHFT